MAIESSTISTVKLSKKTKDRLLKLKVYKNETFEEIIEKMLNIFNLCRQNPEQAKQALTVLDQQRKINMPNS
ncbi:MAG: hypothetical protein AABX85_04875 [Nanoarchaeota archaeon]